MNEVDVKFQNRDYYQNFYLESDIKDFWAETAQNSKRQFIALSILGSIASLLAIFSDLKNLPENSLYLGYVTRSISIIYFIAMAIIAHLFRSILKKYYYYFAVSPIIVISMVVIIISTFAIAEPNYYFVGVIEAELTSIFFFAIPNMLLVSVVIAVNIAYVACGLYFAQLPDQVVNTDIIITMLIFALVTIFANYILLRFKIQNFRQNKSLERAYNKTEDVLDSILSPFFAFDKDLRFVYINEPAQKLLDRVDLSSQDLIDKNLTEVFPNVLDEQIGMYKAITEASNSQRITIVEESFPEMGVAFEIHIYPSEEGVSVYCHDITERKSLQEQLLQSQKMDAIGRLAGGIAHDFNNLLTTITFSTQMAQLQLPSDSAVNNSLETIINAAGAGSNLSQHLLTFARKGVTAPKIIDLNVFIRRLSTLLQRMIGDEIRVEYKLTVDSPAIFMDSNQLQQMILNLAINARDAMEGGGRLLVTTTVWPKTQLPNTVIEQLESPNTEFVEIAIEDTGVGIDPENILKLFEPFFTTGQQEEHSGLGLAIVYGIVQSANGHIEVESKVGEGAKFRIYLPVAEHDDPLRDLQPPPKEFFDIGDEQNILVVEDEKDIRMLLKNILGVSGYNVYTAPNGEAGLEVIRSFGHKVDLVLTDVKMPEMDGRTMADQIWNLYPDMNIVFMSGYTQDAAGLSGDLDAKLHFLQKPFRVEEVLHMIWKFLDSPSGSKTIH